MEVVTYLLCGDDDTNLFNGLGELLGFDGLTVVEIEVLEGLDKELFLAHGASLLRELLNELFFKTIANRTSQD
jgi:hypothetical protein